MRERIEWNKAVKKSRTYSREQLEAIEAAIESGECKSLNDVLELGFLQGNEAIVKMTLLRTLKGINEKREAEGKPALFLESQKRYNPHDETRYETYKAEMLQDRYCRTPEEWREYLCVRNLSKYQEKLMIQTGIKAPSAYEVKQQRAARSEE